MMEEKIKEWLSKMPNSLGLQKWLNLSAWGAHQAKNDKSSSALLWNKPSLTNVIWKQNNKKTNNNKLPQEFVDWHDWTSRNIWFCHFSWGKTASN